MDEGKTNSENQLEILEKIRSKIEVLSDDETSAYGDLTKEVDDKEYDFFFFVSKYLLIGNTAGTALVFTAILNMDGKAGSLSDNLFYALCIFSFGSICAIIAIGWLFIHYYSTVKFSQRLHDGIVYHKYLKVWQEANRLLNDPLAETVGQVARYKSLINSNQKEIERQKNLMTSKFGLFITLIFISSSCFSTVLFVTFITGVLNLAS